MYSLLILSLLGVVLNTTTTFNHIHNNQCWIEYRVLCNDEIKFCVLHEVHLDYSRFIYDTEEEPERYSSAVVLFPDEFEKNDDFDDFENSDVYLL